MTDKTPPEWAINAATELEGRGNILDIGVISRTIAAHAPDAEALAVALEKVLSSMKQINQPGKGFSIHDNERCQGILTDALKDYRARVAGGGRG